MPSESKKISASAVGKKLNCSGREVFGKLLKAEMVVRDGNSWSLTDTGRAAGGEYRESSKFGRYIVWPEDIFEMVDAPAAPAKPQRNPLNSTKLGAKFELSPNRMNKLLAEIGWIEKGVKGWHLTAAGQRVGGQEREHHSSGVPFAMWPESIATNPVLIENIRDFTGAAATTPAPAAESAPVSEEAQRVAEFRAKFAAQYRATDGHNVRSRAELAIDNWLYMTGIVHAYERKLPIEEDVYCDFYLPQGKVYIEYWGMENDAKYAQRKAQKLRIYSKYDYRLIELTDDDILSLDDVLPRKLLKFGIKAD